VSEEANTAVIRRFYDELWNRWELDVATEIVSPSIRFRGSIGTTLSGRDAFLNYVENVRAAFPDWHNHIDELLAVDDRVIARLTWSGTHRGPLGDLEASGARVTYVGAAFFRLADAMIEEAWVVGDTQQLWRAIYRGIE
jgi:predicted ester cyclase